MRRQLGIPASDTSLKGEEGEEREVVNEEEGQDLEEEEEEGLLLR